MVDAWLKIRIPSALRDEILKFPRGCVSAIVRRCLWAEVHQRQKEYVNSISSVGGGEAVAVLNTNNGKNYL